MNEMPQNHEEAMKQGRNRVRSVARTAVIAAVCLLFGFALGGWWRDRSRDRSAVHPRNPVRGQEAPALAAGTDAIETDRARDRGIAIQPPAVVPGGEATPATDLAIIAEVKRLLPNFASVSREEGTRVLRASALQNLQSAMSELEPRLREAEQRLARMKDGASDTDKQEALKELQRVQAEQAANLREITTRCTAQIEALRQLKGAYGDRFTR